MYDVAMEEPPAFDTYAELIDWTFESSESVADALDSFDQQTRIFEFLEETLHARRTDLSRERARLTQLREHYELFHSQFAPRGWAMSPTVEKDRGYILLGKAIGRGRIEPEEADRVLADRLYDHAFVERLISFLCMAPLRALWEWAPVAGDAAAAMSHRLALPAALSWLAIFEGMWKDLQPHLGRARPRQSLSRGYDLQNLTEGLTFTRESLATVHSVLVTESLDAVLEPIDVAPTNRHALVHGNISGFIQLHHAVKAYTLVEVTVEEAKKLLQVVDSADLEFAPWR
jgi:hypothetical protein